MGGGARVVVVEKHYLALFTENQKNIKRQLLRHSQLDYQKQIKKEENYRSTDKNKSGSGLFVKET